MEAKSAKEKSIEKVNLLGNRGVSTAFWRYFKQDWQAGELLGELRSAGADPDLLREWLVYSFHPLGNDEAEEKNKRRLIMQKQLKKALTGYQSAIAFYSLYAAPPSLNLPVSIRSTKHFNHLVKLNQYLEGEATAMLQRAAVSETYTTKRLGVNWQGPYLYLSRSYIGGVAGWEERKILGAMTHFIAAAHKSLGIPVPQDLRVLIRKALRAFEKDPRNARIIERLQTTAGDPATLYKLFPKLIAS